MESNQVNCIGQEICTSNILKTIDDGFSLTRNNIVEHYSKLEEYGTLVP